jgi:hypothetical protein
MYDMLTRDQLSDHHAALAIIVGLAWRDCVAWLNGGGHTDQPHYLALRDHADELHAALDAVYAEIQRRDAETNLQIRIAVALHADDGLGFDPVAEAAENVDAGTVLLADLRDRMGIGDV